MLSCDFTDSTYVHVDVKGLNSRRGKFKTSDKVLTSILIVVNLYERQVKTVKDCSVQKSLTKSAYS